MILAINFDQVIHDKLHPVPGRRMGPPMDGAKEALQALTEHTVIIYSVIPEEVIRDWMEYYELPCGKVTKIKPDADVYIDDKALRFENWGQTMSAILKLNEYQPPARK